jgi:hypothetical protein
MDRDTLIKLRPFWGNALLWSVFEEWLNKELEKSILNCKAVTNEREMGKYFFIKELAQLRQRAKDALGE